MQEEGEWIRKFIEGGGEGREGTELGAPPPVARERCCLNFAIKEGGAEWVRFDIF